MLKDFFVGIAVVTFITACSWAYHKFRKKRTEKKIIQYLKENTEDKSGKRFMPINRIVKELNIDNKLLIQFIHQSGLIFENPYDKNMIGLYEQKSVYEERGMRIL